MGTETESVEVVLIHRDPPCKTCLKAKSAIEEAIAETDAEVSFTEIFTGTPEAARYGAVFSPMVLVNGKVASAGFPPLTSSLVKLISDEASRS